MSDRDTDLDDEAYDLLWSSIAEQLDIPDYPLDFLSFPDWYRESFEVGSHAVCVGATRGTTPTFMRVIREVYRERDWEDWGPYKLEVEIRSCLDPEPKEATIELSEVLPLSSKHYCEAADKGWVVDEDTLQKWVYRRIISIRPDIH